ncbi:hypothetical protein C5O78_05435 [Treponema phagedenis]|nr:hypothetical protein C5O78_05435 [Treponema phagedenis]
MCPDLFKKFSLYFVFWHEILSLSLSLFINKKNGFITGKIESGFQYSLFLKIRVLQLQKFKNISLFSFTDIICRGRCDRI